ncbi:MAG: single-stranded-DNA-specific exonuclease RecJ [Bdellovibrionota bacterium]
MEWKSRNEGELPASPVALPQSIWQILYTRGIRTTEDIENHLNPKLKNLSHPFSMDGMKDAVDRLVAAFIANETVAIYGDYDLDGTPGVSLLKSGLESLGYQNVLTDQPLRLKDGYGLHNHKIHTLKEKGTTLIVTVDVGITDVEPIAYAKTLGLDVIITDHHLPKDELPQAFAIVNPNKKECGSGLQFLCGTGVAFYLILALKMEMKAKNLLTLDFNPKELLDLFAIATVTDMVPLIKENRILVKHGLKELQMTKRPGIRALMQNLKMYGRSLDAYDISFKLAPKLNALSRLEEGLRPLDVFLADEEKAFAITDEILAVNDRRRQYQKTAESEAEEMMNASPEKDFIWVFSENFHPGVVSLVANGLMNKYGKPAFVGAIRDGGKIIGSARSPDAKINLQNVFGGVSGSLHKFGGHAMAAGFETHLEKAKILGADLKNYFIDNIHSEGIMQLDPDAAEELLYDAEMNINDFTPQFMNWYDALGPFGMGFKQPLFLMKDLKVKRLQVMKRKKLKYFLTSSQSYSTIEAPWFQKPVEIPEGSQVDILFEPQWNEYMGRRSLQALIKDMRVRS